jgi:restriction endonuclease Mrr
MLEILLIAFGSIGVGFFLILLLAMADRKSKQRRPQAAAEDALTRDQFDKACVEIIERMKLDIEEIQRTEDDNLDIRARNPAPVVGGEFFVRCVYLSEQDGRIQSAEILEMSNVIVQDRLSKGIFMTNGRFADDIPTLSELAPIEFIDGTRLAAMMADLPMV